MDIAEEASISNYSKKFELIYNYIYNIKATCDGFGNITVGSKYIQENRDKASSILNQMRVDITGVRSGETLIGSHNATKGSMLYITSGDSKLYHKSVIRILSFKDLWENYISKLDNIEFFKNKSKQEREYYIFTNIGLASRDDLADMGLRGIFTEAGTNNKITSLDEESISILLSEDQELLKHKMLFPNPRSNSKNTLIFLSTFWKLYQSYPLNISQYTYIFGKGFIKTNDRLPCFDTRFNVILNHNDPLTINIEGVTEYKPSELKSMIQKYIRHRPKFIGDHDAISYTKHIFDALLIHPGSFVPDIQRYVSGQESALKRLLITVFEDAYYDNNDDLLDLAVAAHISQANRSWKIPQYIRNTAHRVIESCFKQGSWWDYKGKDAPQVINPNSQLEWISYLLDKIKSFDSDLKLVRVIAKYGNTIKMNPIYNPPDVIPEEIYLDQHCYPNIAYHFDVETVELEPGRKPLSKFYEKIFRAYTGVNSRKSKLNLEDKFVISIINAQYDAVTKTLDKKLPDYTLKYINTVTSSMLAGEIGIIEAATKPKTYVCLDPNDSNNLLVIRKPTRDSKSQEISEEIITKAKNIAINTIKKGIKTKWGKYTGSESFNYSTIVEYTSRFLESPLLKNPPTKSFLKSLLSYLNNTKRIILPQISRDGGYNNYPVKLDDFYISKFLIYASEETNLVDAINLTTFEVEPYLKDLIISSITNLDLLEVPMPLGNWPEVYDKLDRVPKDYQQYCLDEMLTSSRRGEFLWLDPGSGKTWICAEYIRNKMDLYPCVIYTLPSSALKSVIQELEYFGYPLNYWNPTKRKTQIKIQCQSRLLSYHINIIEHDHLRLLWQEIVESPFITNTLLVVDEVHKTLNNTLRTQAALNIAAMCKSFLLMTGTPIIDYNTHKLTWWLRELVDFEVTDNNFWVAAMSMVNRNVDSNVKIIREDIIPDDELPAEYWNLVSISLGGKNKNMGRQEFARALDICQEICDREMVQLAAQYKNYGVMLVASNMQHQIKLYQMLSLLMSPSEILIMKEPIHLKSKNDTKYRVVIVPQSKSEGYTLTMASIMITGIYFSNNATRTQLEGRINRLGQLENEIKYFRVHKGLLSRLASDYRLAANIQSALKDLLDF